MIIFHYIACLPNAFKRELGFQKISLSVVYCIKVCHRVVKWCILKTPLANHFLRERLPKKRKEEEENSDLIWRSSRCKSQLWY